MRNMLLVDCCGANFLEMDLQESKSPNGLIKFRGKFQEAFAVNKNKRMYPYEVLAENVERLMDCINDRRLLGELDHPTDSIIHFANASHVVTNLWCDGNVLMGEGEILNTPHGKVLQALINDGVKIGISSRGVGNGKVNEDGILVIGESYKLITFDAVADPSTFSAFQEKYVGEKKESVVHSKENASQSFGRKKGRSKSNPPAKKENDFLNEDLLIAYLESFVESQTDKIKSRLG